MLRLRRAPVVPLPEARPVATSTTRADVSAAPLKNIPLAAGPDAAALGHGAEGLRGPRRISPFARNPATAARVARNQAVGPTRTLSGVKRAAPRALAALPPPAPAWPAPAIVLAPGDAANPTRRIISTDLAKRARMPVRNVQAEGCIIGDEILSDSYLPSERFVRLGVQPAAGFHCYADERT